ncbi:MAG TPA: phosphoserine phosphatase SerB [Pararhizobium sp.]|nr:phosphoserine phosphatase SerB [Pararhizobium sp.]
MALVATLVANPAQAALTAAVAERAATAIAASGICWLADGIACDLPIATETAPRAIEQALREAVAPAPVDVVVQEAATRRKAFLIADMDSTMIGQECVDELAAEVGLKDKVAAITARAMNGEIAFEPALRERVALLEGLPLSVIRNVLETRITLAAGGPELVRTMKANGAYTALVSGGFTVFTGPIAEMIGFDEHRANVLMEEDGFLTGKVMEPILGRQAKTDALHDITQRLGISPLETLAVGDGANDLGMLQLAGTGVALHAKPAVAAAADVRIDHSDLTALLYIQGYSREEFAT